MSVNSSASSLVASSRSGGDSVGHDYSVRMRAAKKFLQDGDKVKVIVNMKGRENEFRNIAIELLRRFQTEIGELATEESKNFRDRNLFVVLVPNKEVVRKSQEPSPKKKKKPADDEVSAAGITAT
ncbi:hypothetical protein F2Q68_00037652 [Brassica cretica]|uniref:Translation initiation factor 3 C-terminal domain-containing protein n=1 Tax=Brassica cretica TaxID=69181 RepID=A0A8S9HAM9_BRACR|nr:hypothetical protein F2Q68_00037652 [Brassica cretica]